ncbi:MAG TPA: secondary thiamine-phosphate synthase enzyme YjbQ [Deltaproteobacteria bacterium]|nr:secondary thiamine-phosphate synthase enzyme YjbQ [Deltaproteobacteria bacterium]HOM28573.1 secondary thiamine-phosphate synthase enzyme YjbQ [Deltaproteobacteria bacterium]HPP79916.1 secondary thiamine-phosphate synthase enzyme YjbQ [Deltaproteobacteria bacterium]
MIKRLELKTSARTQLVDITAQVKGILRNENITSGMAFVYVPHTTCGITINENADPSVKDDILRCLERLVPQGDHYRHAEGNADAHIKATLVGSSVALIIEGGAPVLGQWQAIYLAEFDGPRKRSVLVKIMTS